MRRAFGAGFFILAISLIFHVIYPSVAVAAPTLESLGRISEGLSVPSRLDTDTAGNLYVADPRQKTIFVFDKFGKPAAQFPVADLSGGGLAVTPDGKQLYASCSPLVRILDSSTGQLLGELTSSEHPFTSIGFIDIDPQGRIYVADTRQRVVFVFAADGSYLRQFGDPASSSGQFASIFALAVDPASSEVYVGDSLRSSSNQAKVMVFSPQGDLLRSLVADDEGGFGTPVLFFFGGITFDGEGNGYFPDTYHSNVRVMTLPQTYQTHIAMPPLLPGNMERPVDAAFDTLTNRLFVACDGSRIEVFGLNGAGNPNPNNPPGMPVLFDPIAGSETGSATPRLVFHNAEDPDNDTLSYDVRLFKDGEVVAGHDDLARQQPDSFAQVDQPLQENTQYTWSARARDASTSSAWSAEQSFYVNALQEAPATPELIVPQEVPELDGSGRLSWLASSDPDPHDTVSYRVEIFNDGDRLEPVAVHELASTFVTLAEFDTYALLVNGQTYAWQVAAIDNHELASEFSTVGQFTYSTTLLRVDADDPAAMVYLGGNQAYPGQLLGQVPVELRDFPAGVSSVVIEAPGYETFVRQIVPQVGSLTRVDAVLTPAPVPSLKDKSKTFLETGAPGVAPFLVDFDNDGLLDLLTGEAGGAVTLYPGVATRKELPAFAEGIILELPLIPGAVPFIADWDNDGRKDLLIGGDNGTISLFMNTADETAPVFDGGTLLQADGVPIAVAGRAVPFVIDLDGDKNKDLLVGTGSGEILYYRNLADDHAPQLAAAKELAKVPGAAVPFAVDWDADGIRDLLVSSDAGLVLFLQETGGSFSQTDLPLPEIYDPFTAWLKTRSARISERLPAPFLFVLDVDGKKGKDLLLGNSDGSILLFKSKAKVKKKKQTVRETKVDQEQAGSILAKNSLTEIRSALNDLLLKLRAKRGN